jgi:hypothetical protein
MIAGTEADCCARGVCGEEIGVFVCSCCVVIDFGS